MYCFYEYNCRLWGVRGLNVPGSFVDTCANCKTQYIVQLCIMYDGKLDFIPLHTFRRCVRRYDGEHKVHPFRCTEQYGCMAFALGLHVIDTYVSLFYLVSARKLPL